MKTDLENYFEELDSSVGKAYELAKLAKSKKIDPSEHVEIPLAKNMAERVEGLIGVASPQIIGKGLPQRIEELEKKFGKLDWRVGLEIAYEVSKEKFCKFKDIREAIEIGIRVGFAYVTVGVVASPLEGFTGVKIRKRKDNKEYLALCYSGPVRSAGGTAASISVLIADYLRIKFGYAKYDPTEKEIKRSITELTDYHERITNLQYFPTSEEITEMVSNLPLQIDGDPTEKMEVSNHKDLERIDTNRIRGGFCLVVGECLCQKAKKVNKQLKDWGDEMGMTEWKFMEKFCKLQTKINSKKKDTNESNEKISPDYNFIKDIVAGRPVLTYPLRKGGFRLRYGRCRNTGLSSTAIHPMTMEVLNKYIAIGTQLKMERPGKGTALSSCDSLEGPIVKLENGDVVRLDETNYKEVKNRIQEIIFLGDILIPYGDFLNRAHSLVPPGYCEEWWLKEIKSKQKLPEEIEKQTGINLSILKELFMDPIKNSLSVEDSYTLSKKLDVPFHPRYTYHWKDISIKEFLVLIGWLVKSTIQKENSKIILPLDQTLVEETVIPKRVLEKLGVPHRVVSKEHIVIEKEWAISFLISLGIYEKNVDLKLLVKEVDPSKPVLEIVNKFSDVRIRDKSGIFIGARMGRPEKAKIRKLKGSPHALFPVGEEGGRLRCFQAALSKGKIKAEFPLKYCEKCDLETIYPSCEVCNFETTNRYYCRQCKNVLKSEKCLSHENNQSFLWKDINISEYYLKAMDRLGLKNSPELVKGVRGMSNEDRSLENLSKGILRAIHNLTVNKDGTIRYDMTELALTHFTPEEIGTDFEKLKDLGYVLDIHGKKLESNSQVLQLKHQDIILPSCKESQEEGSDAILYRVSKFVDDLLVHLYGLKPYYNLNKKEDLVGHLIISLAPHTSAGVVGRIIGFSGTQGCYASPVWHCAQRRDCDGDECGIMLLMDGLLNFSRKYLPSHRGATQDAPLVLTSNVLLTEVDDMVFDMDCVWEYPLEFYEACENYKMPWEIKIETIGNNLGKKDSLDIGYTHETKNINEGIRYSAYKEIPTMEEKVLGQMNLAEQIRAVDEDDVARLVIDRHFIRDIKGNLRKFSMQEFRCVECNEKYRRIPLVGKCLKCKGKIIFTISEGSVTKYLTPSLTLAERYTLPKYTFQSLDLLRRRIESVFGKEADRQEGLGRWFG